MAKLFIQQTQKQVKQVKLNKLTEGVGGGAGAAGAEGRGDLDPVQGMQRPREHHLLGPQNVPSKAG